VILLFLLMARNVDEAANFVFVQLIEQEPGIYDKRYPDYPKKKLNSVAVVRKRTIPTERPPLVGEVSANLCGYRCCVVSATNSHGR
jgi:hypothetical protein